jgi:hypothetical protein
MLIWVELKATKPVEFTVGGAQPALAGRPLPSPDWDQEPQGVAGKLAITMQVRPAADGDALEYLFERSSTESGRHTSGWVAATSYADRQLAPNTNYRYRVKARNRYLQESDWSTARAVQTSDMAAPVIWRLNEGKGRRVRDTSGRHAGQIQGEADWASDRLGTSLRFDGTSSVVVNDQNKLATTGDFTWAAWIKTEHGGAVIARAGRGKEWEAGGKVLFVADGRLMFDVAWVGVVGSKGSPLDDDQWHHVAVTVHRSDESSDVTLFADGRRVGAGRLPVDRFPESGLPLKMGCCNEDFPPRQAGFVGPIRDVRWCGYALPGHAIAKLSER